MRMKICILRDEGNVGVKVIEFNHALDVCYLSKSFPVPIVAT